ncbi:hypothetical protein ST47_g8140 [Ascochyta rabiei]|uniref:Uncharacterized protein n=1 Tax=Didymella rabiei TaxID=5454 RepID=A0A162ZPL7_DIDRA|nr:hypothetical protein ST47_g8140 [Ascochyta rabiei]
MASKTSNSVPTPRHRYPGLELPLREDARIDDAFFPIGAHGSCWGANFDPLSVRELAMMSIMESLTDEPDWHVKINDENVVSKWRTGALSIPNKHWWGLATGAKRQHWEADGYVNLYPERVDGWIKVPDGIMSEDAFDFYFQKTNLVPTLDAGASVVKSDTLVFESLQKALLTGFETLKTDQINSPDWHPNSDETVQSLEVLGVQDAIAEWSGKGDIIFGEDKREPTEGERWGYTVGGSIPPTFWSTRYQWLPSNRLIETSLPLWDQCLTTIPRYNKRTSPERTERRFDIPSDLDDDNPLSWIPSDPKVCSDIEVSEEELENEGWEVAYFEKNEDGHRRFIALWLVDPHKRIISTANVPPQQMSWTESMLDRKSKPQHASASQLPHELVSLLQENNLQLPPSSDKAWTPEELIAFLEDNLPRDALPMTIEEAKEHRLNLMKERSAFVETSEAPWQQHQYSFCEH